MIGLPIFVLRRTFMNESFVLLDKINNLQRKAEVIVKFNFEGLDYLIYSVMESEQNNQVFVSKLILNSEGKYFIDNISSDEKRKLNNIVYNIVILVPTEVQKGNSFEVLSKGLTEKFFVKLVPGFPDMGVQEYFSNCSVAITSKVLVDAAVKLYRENLIDNSSNDDVLVPTWTAPSEVTAPVEAPVSVESSVLSNVGTSDVLSELVSPSTIPVQADVNVSNLNLQPVSQESVVMPSGVVNNVVSTTQDISGVSNASPNPQAEKLAIVSDPSLSVAGISTQQPNVGKLKKAGFANTKYIVIGTVCLVLAVLVVVVAYIIIKNMK